MTSAIPAGRRRILVLFLLGVALPSAGLAYLAFRGIRNERAMEAQRGVEQQRAAFRTVVDNIDRRLTAAETELRTALAGSDASGLVDPDGAGLRELLDRHPIVEAVFVVDSTGTVRVRAPRLLYHRMVADPQGTGTLPAPVQARLRAGEEHEFRERRVGAALADYRAALAEARGADRAPVLLAIARVQGKGGQHGAAMESWEGLRRDFGAQRLPGGAPVGAVAHLELAALRHAAGDTAGARGSYRTLYGELLDGTWPLDRGQVDFLCARVRDGLSALDGGPARPVASVDSAPPSLSPAPAGSDPTLADLMAREAALRDRAERLLRFEEAAGRELWPDGTSLPRYAEGGEAAAAAAPAAGRTTVTAGGRTYLVSVIPGISNGAAAGLLVDADHVQDVVLLPALTAAGPVAGTWRLRDRDGTVLAESSMESPGAPTLTASFPGGFPPWLLELHRPSESTYRRLLGSSQSVYLYMFVLIAGILVFGLVITVRAVGHELALARLRSDFVATVSHEFRSPLTSIRQLAEMLQRGRVPSEARRQRYYDVLVEQSTRLSTLVTNILDVARIEDGRGELRFQQVDLRGLLEELVDLTRHRTAHDGFEIELDMDDGLPPVRGDPEALGHAVSNLLDNAVRYSGASRRVVVRARVEEDGGVAVSVRDLGIGIPAEEQDRVFDRFFRGSEARSAPGSGMGLTLVKEVVGAHGGRVELASEPGTGSTFTVRLPAWRSGPEPVDDHVAPE